MRKAFFALITVMFAIGFSISVYAQNETGNQTQPAGPCANVQCNSPPAAECDGSSVRTYSSGTCSNGQCSYPSSTTSCRFGCSLGTCKPCEPGSCGTDSKTCPDGFVATCQQTCGGNACVACTPNCQGHETAPTQNTSASSGGGSTSGTCPGQPAVPQCASDAYPEKKIDNNGCVVEYNCVPLPAYNQSTSACPALSVPTCSPDSYLKKNIQGACTVGYECVPIERPKYMCGNNACEPGEADTLSACPPGSPPECLGSPVQAGTCPQDCQSTTQSQQYCPQGCECKYDGNGNIIATSCPTQKGCNYNGICDKDEDSSCKDCIGGECPIKQSCPGGAVSICRRTESGCACDPCPVPSSDLPPGCRQEIDKENNFVRVVCDKAEVKCQPVTQEVRLKCVNSNGLPRFGRDSNGCDTFQCDFGGERSNSPVFATPVKCPSPEEVSSALEKCKSFNMEGVVGFEGGCKIGKCISQNQHEKKPECINPTEDEKMNMELKCRQGGMELVFEFNKYGCNEMRCGQRNDCQRDMPKDSYSACAEKGGQLVVRRDQNGCVSFTECLRRGEESSSFVENIDEVPDAGELLSIAFKLEDLKLQFDKLSRKTDDIANYYQSTGSSEEKRFRRVSDMFMAAKDKVDEIKNNLRDRSRDMSVDGVMEIKQDIKYIKDVVLKDILYVMLGSGDEIEEIKTGTTKNCGTDGSCFDRAIRICQPVTFRPEGRDGPIVELKGLEGDACIMYAKLPEGQGPPGQTIDMTCKIQKYSLGVRNPETDIFPYCTGSMVEMIKKYGTEGPGVPGKCSGDSCRDYCGRGPSEAKECLQYMSDVLPEDAKQGLQALAEGRFRGGGFGGDFNEGEFENEFGNSIPTKESGGFSQGGGGQLCPDGICDDFEQKNPNVCPQDCGGTGSGGTGGFAQPQTVQPQFQPQPTQLVQPQSTQSSRQVCSGCLNNGVCDPGECSECADCLR